MATKLNRFTITLSPRSYELLQKLSEVHHTSKSKVLDRMLLQSLEVGALLTKFQGMDADEGQSHG